MRIECKMIFLFYIRANALIHNYNNQAKHYNQNEEKSNYTHLKTRINKIRIPSGIKAKTKSKIKAMIKGFSKNGVRFKILMQYSLKLINKG